MRSRFVIAAAIAAAGAAILLATVRTVPADEAGDEAASGPFENVEVLTHVTSKAEMRRIMKIQAASLGVKCTHCHVPGKFGLDDKEEKVVARRMMRMVDAMNREYFPDAKEPAITCWTCHRGEAEPAHEIPPELLRQDSFEAE